MLDSRALLILTALLLPAAAGPRAQAPPPAPRAATGGALSPDVLAGLERMRFGDYQAAGEMFEKAMAENPDDIRVGLFLVEVLQRQQPVPFDRLEEELRRLQKRHAESPLPLLGLAKAYRDHGRLDKAEAICHEGLETFPEDANLLHVLGTVRVERGELDAGLRLLQRAAETAPEDRLLQRDLGLALVDKGLDGRALMTLGPLRETLSRDAKVRRALADLYRKAGSPEQAEAEEREAEFLEELNERRNRREENAHRLSVEIDGLEAAARGDAPPPGTFPALWNLYQRRGDMAWNAARMEELARLHSDSYEARAALGRALLAGGKPDEGEKVLRNVLERVPDDPLALQGLFLLYGNGVDKPELMVVARRAVEERPESASAHLFLGHAWLASEDAEKATEEYRRGLELDPENLEVLVTLANHLRIYGDPAEASSLLIRALAVAPDRPRVYMALGIAAFQDKDWESAWTYLTQAEDLGGRHPNIYWKLGTLLSRKGREKEAWMYWNLAKSLTPPGQEPGS
jgi:tetratricopeptide (TPR) repeat protein